MKPTRRQIVGDTKVLELEGTKNAKHVRLGLERVVIKDRNYKDDLQLA